MNRELNRIFITWRWAALEEAQNNNEIYYLLNKNKELETTKVTDLKLVPADSVVFDNNWILEFVAFPQAGIKSLRRAGYLD